MRRFWAWINRRIRNEQLAYAGQQYTLAMAAGDTRRAARLKVIMNTLKERTDD